VLETTGDVHNTPRCADNLLNSLQQAHVTSNRSRNVSDNDDRSNEKSSNMSNNDRTNDEKSDEKKTAKTPKRRRTSSECVEYDTEEEQVFHELKNS